MIGVYITLLNDENLIEECWRRVSTFFDRQTVWVCDLGSTDDGAWKVAELGAQVDICGRIKPEEYAEWKNDRAKHHSQVFWIDADEWWPADALRAVQYRLDCGQDCVSGYWRNLKREGEQLYVSEPTYRGRVAWNTGRYRVGRAWPHECLQALDGSKAPDPYVHDPGIYCWHGVLLERSSLPEDPLRAAKRRKRQKQFAGLHWTQTELEKLT